MKYSRTALWRQHPSSKVCWANIWAGIVLFAIGFYLAYALAAEVLDSELRLRLAFSLVVRAIGVVLLVLGALFAFVGFPTEKEAKRKVGKLAEAIGTEPDMIVRLNLAEIATRTTRTLEKRALELFELREEDRGATEQLRLSARHMGILEEAIETKDGERCNALKELHGIAAEFGLAGKNYNDFVTAMRGKVEREKEISRRRTTG